MDRFVETVSNINGAINDVVWGTPMLILILCTGIYICVRTRFFHIIYAKFVANNTLFAIFKKKSVRKTKDKNAISQFQALSTALAATIGTGNIAGVATAITVGGPGAVFWMWVSAFFGMMTSYAENVLGIYYRRKNADGEWCGGAMYYIQNGLQNKKSLRHVGKVLSVLFALFCVTASFGIGNMAQINNISTTMKTAFSAFGGFEIPPPATGIVLSVILGLVVIGGIKRIGSVTEKVVPTMALFYILGTLIIFIMNIKSAPAVFGAIFTDAFGYDAVVGGISGALIKSAVTMGLKRGIFSNEAGLGSSVIVNSASDVKEPAVQGMWGIFAVFADTIVVCTLTAFSVLSTGIVDLETGIVRDGLEGTQLVTAAFSSTIHGAAGIFVAVSTLFFAFSTVLGWSFYGTKAMEYLGGGKASMVYKVIFVLFVIVGATMRLDLAWEITDTLNGLMAIPNLIGVLVLSGDVFAITKNYVARCIKKTDTDLKPMLSAYPDIQEAQEKLLAEEKSKI
ncbi:MAG: alanine/glycine:cation symporter family protein [Oscillospiraceae bacterium]